MAETIEVTVKDVSEPNSNGFREITFEDAEPASTKSDAVAEAAFQSRGTKVEAVIAETKRGKFTNRYLNAIAGVDDGGGPKRGNGSRASSTTGRRSGGGRSPEEQDRIARQWAIGRAVELLIGSGEEFTLPLEGEQLQRVLTTADSLYEGTSR